MEKIITVGKVAKPKKGYIECLTISGAYLKKHGFEMGDFVVLKVSQNEIRIVKNASTSILTEMGTKNANLLRVIENLELAI